MALPTQASNLPGDGGQQTQLFTLQQIQQAISRLNQTLATSPALASLLATTSAINLGVYANDAAAAAGGVLLHGLYLNSSTFALTARHV